MEKPPVITGIEVHEFRFEVQNMTRSRNGDTKYAPGETIHTTNVALKVHTDSGIVGEYINSRMVDASAIRLLAQLLIGPNALERERPYVAMKRAGQQVSRLGMGLIDIALWDIAGKFHNAPVYQLLGGYRTRLPTYASTYSGDEGKGGLNTPEAYAESVGRWLAVGAQVVGGCCGSTPDHIAALRPLVDQV